ncbi:MAG: phage tail sheath family protein [Gammaproteobacteria bacterium]
MRILPDRISPYRGPGVHIDFAARDTPLPFTTGVPVFVGFGKLAPGISKLTERPWCWIASWGQFEQSVEMSLHGASYLRYAVRGFFENGGERCAVLPIAETQPTADALGKPFRDTDSLPSGVPGDLNGIMEDIEGIDLVCIPDLMREDIRQSFDTVLTAQRLVLNHCRKMGDRFAILDAFPGTEDLRIDRVISDRSKLQGSEGALYFPWLHVRELSMSVRDSRLNQGGQTENPAGSLTIRRNDRGMCLVPPCGHVAGVYARTDAKSGVFKAPANEILEGAIDLGASLTQDEQAELIHSGINCIRSNPGRGIRVWGARTLSAHPHEQFVTTRRLVLTMVRWMDDNMSDLAFENHDESLWLRIRHRLNGYCEDLFQKGALQGQTREDAYFVKCDRELNAKEGRELGKVISEVGLATAAPAEFIVVRITQSARGPTAALLS